MKLRWKIAQFAEHWWWKLYMRKKDTTSYIAWKKNYWNQLLQSIAVYHKPNAAHNIADLGCGPSGIAWVLQHAHITAIDPLMLQYKNNFPQLIQQYPTHTRFITSSIEQYEPDSLFDTVYCINAINHTYSLHESIQNIANMVKEQGTVILSTDCHKHTLLRTLFTMIPGDILHPHQYTQDQYATLLQHYGFAIEHEQILLSGVIFNYVVYVLRKK